MNIVDSSGWLAYFADEPNAKHFLTPLSDSTLLVVPTVTIYEVFKVILRESGEHEALQAVVAMQKGKVVDLNASLAITASRLSLEHNLPMADSIILATAQEFNAVLWTQDSDFKNISKVKYFSKSRLFESTEINGLKLSNRFVRSATWEGMAGDDGSVTTALEDLLARLAEGGVGLIISSHAFITPEGQASPRQLGVYQDGLIDGLKQMTRGVHEAGGKIVLQLAHAGGFARSKVTGQTPLAPSAVEGFSKILPKEMTPEDIREVTEAFGLAARRAKEAGFDGVQIHAAHGYLLSQFLSPHYNKRIDEYGGTAENRYRVLGQVLKKVRASVGNDFPVLVKLNSQDFLEGGLRLEDSVKIGGWLQEDGIDAIELSGGTLNSGPLSPSRSEITTEEREAYFTEGAKAFKAKVTVPILLVGGIRSWPVAERIIEQGIADYISMSRPFIREPGLIRRWQSGDLRPAFCLSDNQCFGPAMSGKGIYCVVEKKEKEKMGA